MYARVTELTYAPDKLPNQQLMDQFNQLRAQQPGYRGNLIIDLGNGRRLNIIFHDTKEQSEAAVPTTNEALRPFVEQHLMPLMTAPPRLVSEGPVIFTDLRTT
jgi:hypothetical protein